MFFLNTVYTSIIVIFFLLRLKRPNKLYYHTILSLIPRELSFNHDTFGKIYRIIIFLYNLFLIFVTD